MSASAPAGLPPLGPPRPVGSPSVTRSVLPNGLTVWIVKRPGLPLAAVRLVARGGRGADPAGRPGTADLLAAALKEGTRSRTGRELAAILQGAGAELETAAGPEAIVLQAQGPAAKVRTVVDTLAEALSAPSFPPDGVARVQALAQEELATDETDPAFLAGRAFARAVYGLHPYSVVAPERETIERVTPESLHVDARSLLRPERTLLVVAGDVDPDFLLSRVERRLGEWLQTGSPAPDVPDAQGPSGFRRILVVDRPGSVQTVLAVGGLGVSRGDPEAFPMALATTVYGGAFTSRLVDNLRSEKGYTYSPHAVSTWLPRRGVVRTRVAVRNEVAAAALNEVFYEMDRMGATDASEEELDRARRRDLGYAALRLETLRGLAVELSDLWLHGLGPEALTAYAEALPGLGAAEVRAVSRRRLSSARALVVAVGDGGFLREELAPFGPVEDAPSL